MKLYTNETSLNDPTIVIFQLSEKFNLKLATAQFTLINN